MRLKIGKNWVMGVALMFGLATTLMAGTTGKIAGRVIDADTKEGLPGANVVIEGTKMGAATDLDGYFVILNVPPGTYNVKASMLGYQPVVIKGVRVEADRTTEVNFKLKQTALVEKELVVVAKAPVIKKDLTASVNIVKGEDIQTLPVADVSQVVTQQAGVIERGGLHIRGGREGESVYVVDGVEVRDPYGGFTTAGIPLLAMEETAISKGGFDVDQGTAASGAINIITKEGGPKYEAMLRYRTGDFAFLGDKVFAFLDANTGDPYLDLILEKDTSLNDPVGKHKAEPHTVEFSVGGPLLPNKRSAVRFFLSGYFNRDKGRFPVSLNPDWNNWEERYQWKVSIPTTNFKIFTSGFYNQEASRPYSPDWRLALDHLRLYTMKLKQGIFGVNYIFNPRTYLEVRFGYFEDDFLYNVIEDVDNDGVDDFADRDNDGYIEVDEDYFIDQNGNPIDICAVFGCPLDRGNGWVELPLHWWDSELVGLYPTIANGPSWWSDDPNDFPNRAGWGRKTRVDLVVVRDLNGNLIVGTPKGDTVIGSDTFATVNPLVNGEYIDESVEIPYRELIVKIGNQYLPDNHTWPRSQWYYGRSKSYSLTARFTSQVTKAHEILAGIEYKKFDFFRYGADYASGGNFYYTFVNVPFIDWFEDYPTKPWTLAAYFRDKIEIEGMVAKIGFRFDYLNPGGWYASDSLDPFDFDPTTGWGFIKNPTKAETKWHISPRIGISHPISERDVLHFTYGHYYQLPPFSYVARDYVFSGAFPILGNANLDPEKQISYEIGVKHAFTENVVMDVTAYYKDIKGWTRLKMIFLAQYGGGRNYSTYVNEDYGDVRGIEFDFSKRPGGAFLPFIGFDLAYTYQIAKGSFSSPGDAYHWAWSGYPMPDMEHPLDWDQRHTLLLTLSLISPPKTPLFGISDWGLTFQYNYGSGYPYTPPIRTQREAMELINSKRLPSTSNVNMRFYKNFTFSPFKIRLFVDVYNLFNKKNLTGFDNVEWYEQFNDPEGEVKNPTVWGARRTTRFGIEIHFTEQ